MPQKQFFCWVWMDREKGLQVFGLNFTPNSSHPGVKAKLEESEV